MSSMCEPRQFVDSPAVREKVPLWFGLAGASGSGKTFSALRVARGMQKVFGGEIYGIDTESKRMLHYADTFKFRHIPFSSPFGSLDYLEAVKHAQSKGATITIIDSASHEHEGPGGCLDLHEQEIVRLCKGDMSKAFAMQMLAWGLPKGNRRKMMIGMLQINMAFIFCFRAKEKVKLKKRGEQGENVKDLGFMPIAGEELVYEMTANALLMPGSGGVPTWTSQEIGEKTIIKLPEQFKRYFLEERMNQPLDESAGEFMARWAMGDAATVSPAIDTAIDTAIALARITTSSEEFEQIAKDAGKLKGWTEAKKQEMAALCKQRRAEFKEQSEREPGE